MSHNNTIFSQILKLVPRHDFQRLAQQHDGERRSDAMSRWTQFVAISTAHLAGRSSLRDIESTIASQHHLRYHLGSGSVKRTTLSRMNQTLSFEFYESLFNIFSLPTTLAKAFFSLQKQTVFFGCLIVRCFHESLSQCGI